MKNIFLLKIIFLQLFVAGAYTTFAQPKEDVRILVVYTKKVSETYGSTYVKDFIDGNIGKINVAFNNSGINHRVLLVGKEEINSQENEKTGELSSGNYSPYGFSNYYSNFLFFLKQGKSGGIYSDVPNLISTTQADICILLVTDLNVAGAADRLGYDDIQIAKGKGNDSRTAYAVFKVTPTAISRMTMPHEVGHIYGCRHEMAQDPTPGTAHGYVLAGTDAQGYYLHDIMAYGVIANGGIGTNPIPYFSDPNRTYNGFPLGDANSNAVERINNKGYSDLKAGKSIVQDFIINSDIIDKSGEFIEVTAKNTITTSSTATIDVEADTSLILYVPAEVGLTKSIKLKPGFHAEAGSSFLATTSANWIPPTPTSTARMLNAEQTVTVSKSTTELEEANSKISIYPNPFTDKVTIKYTLAKDQPVNLMFYDITGKQVGQSIVNKTQSKGKHEFIFDGSLLPAGIYIYKLTVDGIINSGKIIKAK